VQAVQHPEQSCSAKFILPLFLLLAPNGHTMVFDWDSAAGGTGSNTDGSPAAAVAAGCAVLSLFERC
jgi:hypothetical protein